MHSEALTEILYCDVFKLSKNVSKDFGNFPKCNDLNATYLPFLIRKEKSQNTDLASEDLMQHLAVFSSALPVYRVFRAKHESPKRFKQ